jgi:hypothetical protein
MVELETDETRLNAKFFEAVKKNDVGLGLIITSSVIVGSQMVVHGPFLD